MVGNIFICLNEATYNGEIPTELQGSYSRISRDEEGELVAVLPTTFAQIGEDNKRKFGSVVEIEVNGSVYYIMEFNASWLQSEVSALFRLGLPYEENLTNISCVNKGVYEVTHRYSEKYKNHLILNDVPNRRYILIHYGNYNSDTEGCILVGSRFAQINKDSLLDITSSRRTLSELLGATNGKGFKLTIF